MLCPKCASECKTKWFVDILQDKIEIRCVLCGTVLKFGVAIGLENVIEMEAKE